MPLKVHMLTPPEAPFYDHLLRQLDSNIALTFGEEPPEDSDFEILVAGRPEEHHLTASSRLHSLIIPFAGVPDTTRTLLVNYPELRTYNLHHNAIQVAEMAVALMMAAARLLIPADRMLREYDWTPRYIAMPSVQLHGKTVVILGYGRVGQHIARICLGIGMQVLGIRQHPTAEEAVEVYAPDMLHDLLPRAEVLMICLPLTDTTLGLIAEKELNLMPPGAIVVNVGRGEVVDEQALYEALRSNRLHGAGIDVWYQYPTTEATQVDTPPAHYAFEKLDNVVMSPHRAGNASSPEVEYERMNALALSLNSAARDGTIPNRIS